MTIKNKHSQSGFSAIEAVIIILVITALAAVGFYVLGKNQDSKESGASSNSQKTEAKIKHLGVNLEAYDPATNKAGDFEFTKAKFEDGNMIFYEYGYKIPGNSASGGKEKTNPQPTFILPLGTKVYSLVDGTVYDVPKLYSNDYSVMVQGEGSDLIFETEHVINVKVKKGGSVKAGQEIAEVSDYTAKSFAGYGLVEIGVLKGGNPPQHLCPFDYLDDSIKDETLKKITALQKSWEEYRGDTTIYDESKAVIPGCLSREPVEG